MGTSLGSTIAETNTAATQTSRRTYTPYGIRSAGTSILATDRTFTGQQSDETGLMYYNARYYDPTIGHFISPDTIVSDPGNLLDYNRYMYGYGNPVKFSDPSGHSNVVDGGETPMPEWWLKGVKRVNVKGYGVFDRAHIQREYEYAERIMTKIQASLGKGTFIYESHRGHTALYEVSGNVTSEQMNNTTLGIYTHFDYGYEQWQGENGIHAVSAFAVEDLPGPYWRKMSASSTMTLLPESY